MIANKGASGLHCNPPGSGWLWAHLTCGKKALAKIGDLGETRDRQIMSLPRPRPDMQPAAFGGFAISGFWVPKTSTRWTEARGRAPVAAATTVSRAQALPPV